MQGSFLKLSLSPAAAGSDYSLERIRKKPSAWMEYLDMLTALLCRRRCNVMRPLARKCCKVIPPPVPHDSSSQRRAEFEVAQKPTCTMTFQAVDLSASKIACQALKSLIAHRSQTKRNRLVVFPYPNSKTVKRGEFLQSARLGRGGYGYPDTNERAY